MPTEMQIVSDIAALFTELDLAMSFHFGDVLEKGEVDAALTASEDGIARWLVPVTNDKTEEIACATEGLVQTFRASLVVIAKKASDAVEAMIETLQEVYTTSEGVAGVHNAPVEIGSTIRIRFHRFEPEANQLRMSAQNWEGNWLIEQPVLISAEKIS